jgi:hypothetical protein
MATAIQTAPSSKTQCSILGCTTRKSPDPKHFLCHSHWKMVPLALRDRIEVLLQNAPQSDDCQMAIQAAIEEVANQEAFSQA